MSAPDGTAKVEVLRVDGVREEHHVGKHILMPWILRMIGAQAADVVNLRDGRVMVVDDTGMIDNKPANPQATALYHGVCRPGTVHPICGDVAIANDEDFA